MNSVKNARMYTLSRSACLARYVTGLAVLVALSLGGCGGGEKEVPQEVTQAPKGSDTLVTDNTASFFDFGPGIGRVNFQGVPIGVFLGRDGVTHTNLGLTDTIIQRLTDVVLPKVGNSATVQIEVDALSLRSVAPVSMQGVLFDAFVTLDPAHINLDPRAGRVFNDNTGEMTFTRTDSQRGTYVSSFTVFFRVEFVPMSAQTKLSNSSEPRQTVGDTRTFQKEFKSQDGTWTTMLGQCTVEERRGNLVCVVRGVHEALDLNGKTLAQHNVFFSVLPPGQSLCAWTCNASSNPVGCQLTQSPPSATFIALPINDSLGHPMTDSCPNVCQCTHVPELCAGECDLKTINPPKQCTPIPFPPGTTLPPGALPLLPVKGSCDGVCQCVIPPTGSVGTGG